MAQITLRSLPSVLCNALRVDRHSPSCAISLPSRPNTQLDFRLPEMELIGRSGIPEPATRTSRARRFQSVTRVSTAEGVDLQKDLQLAGRLHQRRRKRLVATIYVAAKPYSPVLISNSCLVKKINRQLPIQCNALGRSSRNIRTQLVGCIVCIAAKNQCRQLEHSLNTNTAVTRVPRLRLKQSLTWRVVQIN